MPAERVIHVIRQVCHSLSEAESTRLVHRDIKPANIFLCRYGEDYDFVKVLDFGIVKAIQRAGQCRSGADAHRASPRSTSSRARRHSSRRSRRSGDAGG